MNPLTKVKLVSELNEREAHIAVAATASWHSEYKDSAWIFVGGLPFELTEGDILCVFSQYGEIVNINLVRDQKTGKSKGFCFICYEDQRSTVLAVDNFNGIKIKGRTIRVDHVSCYRPPRVLEGVDDATRKLWQKGCGIQTSSSSSSEGSEDEALSEHHKQEKQKRSKTKERTTILVKDEERQTQQPLFLAARGQIKMEDTLGSDERAKVKLESREGRKHQPSCPEARKTAVVDSFLQGAEGSGEWTQGGESKF